MPDSQWTYPDGSSITDHEDGSVTVTDANGAKTHYDPATGRRTETPAPGAGGQPTRTTPTKQKTEDGEIKITYPDGTRIYIRLNPRRFRIARSLPAQPHKDEVDLPTGTRRIQEVKDGEITTTPPTTTEPRRIDPSEHPAPPPTPPGNKGKKGKSRKKRRPSKKRKPARKASKQKRRKKARR